MNRVREAVKRIREDALTIYFVGRDHRTPVTVRLLAIFLAAYTFSPIDLIPDFIPVLGYLDELILLPLGILLILKLTPTDVINASRAKAAATVKKPTNRYAMVVIVVIWAAAAWAVTVWLLRVIRP